jgi:predicted RNA-binding protein with PUA domain
MTADDLARLGTCTLDDESCSVCGDNTVPVRVVAEAEPGLVTVEDRLGVRAVVATAFTPDARPGDVLLVTAGVALSHIPAAEPVQS